MTTTAAPFVLRGYQQECLDTLQQSVTQGANRLGVILPTGTGKTEVFSRLSDMIPGRMLVVAHREELLDQAANKLQRANPTFTVDIEQAGRKATAAPDVVVASVRTLSASPARLARLDPDSFGRS